jgi:hypothetical protein
MKEKYTVLPESGTNEVLRIIFHLGGVNEVKFVHSRLAVIVREVLYSLFIEILR